MLPLFLALAGLLSVLSDQLSVSSGRKSEVRSRKSELGGRFSVTVLLVWLVVPIIGSLLVPRASVRFSPKYLIAITPVYYLLIAVGLKLLKKESRLLFWVCVLALIAVSLYSLGDYYLRQHDKLAALPSPRVEGRAETIAGLPLLVMTDSILSDPSGKYPGIGLGPDEALINL
jgi:hypothetical protein